MGPNGPQFDKALSGGLRFDEPPFDVTASNITPHGETGIGKWSEDDIVKTIRTGQRADGSPVLPPMPWPMYTRLTDEDAYAIAAYLKSLTPVVHKVPDKLPPGAKPASKDWVLPKPGAWDAPRAPAEGDTAHAAN